MPAPNPKTSKKNPNNKSTSAGRDGPGRAADGAPSRNAAGEGAPSSRRAALTPEEKELLARQRKIEELQRTEEEARRERLKLQGDVVARGPPKLEFREFGGKRKGFTYTTWFKAFGSMNQSDNMGDSPTLLDEMEELDDLSIPSAFYSHGITGQVKWAGIRDREELIADLNSQSPWAGLDFREIYPKWEYYYQIVESVGNVAVRIYEYRAKHPPEDGFRKI